MRTTSTGRPPLRRKGASRSSLLIRRHDRTVKALVIILALAVLILLGTAIDKFVNRG